MTISLDSVAALRTRRARDETGKYFAEGVRFLVAAVDAAAPIEATVVVPALLKSAIGQLLVRRLRQRGIPELRVDRETFLRISNAREPQSLGVVLRQHFDTLPRVPMEHGACWLALESVQSHGNLGTLLRTSEAAGATGLIALGPSVDPFDPNAVRATMGALFTRRLARATPAELRVWARANGAVVIGASGDACTDYRAVRYDRPVVLVLGGERRGLSLRARAACDAIVRIPMTGRTDSLNLAVAGSILLYEVWSQRHPQRR